MACTISMPSNILIDRTNVMKYSSMKTKSVARISCVSKTATGQEQDAAYLRMKQTDQLKEFKQVFMKSCAAAGDELLSLERLACVDAIQRLGIDHHFQEELEMDRLKNWQPHCQSQHLYHNSLYFRLSRQEGHHVSASDLFSRFKNDKGSFGREEYRKDVRGLMALYEASQLLIKGEDILEEAAYFSSHLLNQLLIQDQVDKKTAANIANTLKHPLHKSLTLLNCRESVSIGGFEGIQSWERPLRELSNLEFLIAQQQHRQELHQVFKWWKDVGLAKEIKCARDEPLKRYTGSMGMLPDLTLSDERIDLAKCISLVYIIDDFFDLCGKPDELALFTEVVNRWELSAADQLPDYMKKCFHTLYDITNEIGYKIQLKYASFNPVWYLKKSWARLCNAFLLEARWFDSDYLPKSEEYLNNGRISSGVDVALVHVFFLIGLGTTKDVSIKLERVSGIISSVATIIRLWDDLGSAKDEDQNGLDGSYIACYLKEHPGTSVKVAREHVFQLIADEWKQLNEECLGTNRYFASFKKASLNTARMAPLAYDYDNKQRFHVLNEYIKILLCDDRFATFAV